MLDFVGYKCVTVSKLAIHIDWHKLTWVVAVKFVCDFLFYVIHNIVSIAQAVLFVNIYHVPALFDIIYLTLMGDFWAH